MYHHSNRILMSLCICNILMACNTSKVADNQVDPFINNVIINLNELKVLSIDEFPTFENEIYKPMLPKRDKNENFIIIDGSTWHINLVALDGTLLDRVGGEGRGPGEFVGIGNIEITDDNQLYVLDFSLRRITHYNVTISKIEFVNTYPVGLFSENQLPTGQFRSLHAIEKDFFGVVATPRPDRRFELYKLNETFQPIEKVFELDSHFPGIHFSEYQITNGRWFSDQSTFNYIFFDSLVVYSLNLNNQSVSRHALISTHNDRIASRINNDFIDLRFNPPPPVIPGLPQVEQKSPMELPQIRNIAGFKDIFIADITYYGGSNSYILHYNTSTKETHYIKAPPLFTVRDIHKNEILGIQIGMDGSNKVMTLKIEVMTPDFRTS